MLLIIAALLLLRLLSQLQQRLVGNQALQGTHTNPVVNAAIEDRIAYFKQHGIETIFDAEHFFDGFKLNTEYALATLDKAVEGGAECLVLCDTNGGSLPEQVADAVEAIKPHISATIGIHTHNDGGLAVANTLAAVAHGAPDPGADARVVDGLGRVGAVIDDLVAPAGQALDQV